MGTFARCGRLCGGFLLVRERAAGIGPQGAPDLRGRRIASIETKGRSFDYDRMVYLRPFASALATKGLTLKDVREMKSVVEREDFLLAAGLLEQDFDIEQWIDRSIIRDAKTLLHAKVGKASTRISLGAR